MLNELVTVGEVELVTYAEKLMRKHVEKENKKLNKSITKIQEVMNAKWRNFALLKERSTN